MMKRGFRSVICRNLLALLVPVLLLSACSVFEPSDGAPAVVIDPKNIVDAEPRKEPILKAGNRNPYREAGKTYHLLPAVKGYKETGIASWYGTKFHGRATSNGELYSLYKPTAAHKTLPIPCYVKVKNEANGREIIVRVNDRGPFHDNRIIDLSYAAAIKLGFAKQGTTLVTVEALDPDSLPTEHEDHRYFLQAGSFKSLISAQNFQRQLSTVTGEAVSVMTSELPGFYRVLLGPFHDYAKAEAIDSLLRGRKLAKPKLIKESSR